MTSDGRVAVAVAVSTERLPSARVMVKSLREHHADVHCYAVVVDGTGDAQGKTSFTTLSLEDLNIPNARQWCFGYGRDVVVIAVKPHLLEHVLDRGYERVVFLDTDMLIVEELAGLLSPAAQSAITLTPHFAVPPPPSRTAGQELRILRAGVFNGGCIGVSEQSEGRRFLSWWQQRLRRHCRHDMASGMHYDQRWLDLVPSMFDRVAIDRDVGINVAYWNLDERRLHEENGRWLVNGSVCRLVHFSGFDPKTPTLVSRHVPGMTIESAGEFARLSRHYAALLAAAGYGNQPLTPDPYGSFDNGVEIPGVVRDIYLDLGDQADEFGDPFATGGPGSFFSWLQSPAQLPSGTKPVITHLWEAIYRRRPDVQVAYSHALGSDGEAFIRWTRESGVHEHELETWPPVP